MSPNPERVRIERGARSGQMIIVSVDSTRLGPALGGCRIKTYPSWRDGLTDAVRLSAAMTEKAALAGLAYGGGKTVVALDAPVTGAGRAGLLADVADLADVGHVRGGGVLVIAASEGEHEGNEQGPAHDEAPAEGPVEVTRKARAASNAGSRCARS